MRFLAALLILILVAGCKGRVDAASPQFVDEQVAGSMQKTPEKNELTIYATGEFEYNTRRAAGGVIVGSMDGMNVLLLQKFQVEARPGLRLQLVAPDQSIIDLGPLQGYQGSYRYVIPGGMNPAEYVRAQIVGNGTVYASAPLTLSP